MAGSKKAQSKAGVPERRRGQQMGDERSAKDKTLEPRRSAARQLAFDPGGRADGHEARRVGRGAGVQVEAEGRGQEAQMSRREAG
jgi:hypothetical protein